ncbi:hypothetical protein JWG45_15975 [Leptospira sp. 201903070]|uniref:Uncharacterized protein n=2 Tax=Leptospira TaxID=171 RepID=A0A396Z5T2_9LEPT|nr:MULTISPECIES: hypothetical protein [Leptospira]MBM9578644.1 hypothetical protein [Leptospira ainlahdjerensis]RHX89046.1 hypothetical protein DLM75_14365 [Leptospira stimsonii]
MIFVNILSIGFLIVCLVYSYYFFKGKIHFRNFISLTLVILSFLVFLWVFQHFAFELTKINSNIIDTYLKIIGIFGALVFFTYQFVSGVFYTGIGIKLDCKSRLNDGKRLIYLHAEVTSKTNFIKIYDAKAFNTPISSDLIAGTSVEMKVLGTKRHEYENNFLTSKYIQGLNGNLQINPNDEMTFAVIGEFPDPTKTLLIEFVLLGKNFFYLFPEQWKSSILIIPSLED